MSTLMQQLAMSYEADGSDSGNTVEHVDVGSQIVQAQQQQQSAMQPSRDRETVQLQLHLQQQRNNQHQRDLLHHRMEEQQQQQQQQQRDREQLHQLQTINNLLSDLPSPVHSPQPPSPTTNHPGLRQSYSHDVSHSHSTKGVTLESQFDGDMSISDLFGLSLPRGPLMNGQSTTRSSGINRHNHQYHGHSRNHGFSHQQYQREEGCEFAAGSTTLDLPSSPTSVTTPGSPSTPGSLYSNPYSYSSVGTGTGTRASSVQANRSSFQNLGCSSSSHNAPYYGRPIRGSPPYSDCDSPTLEYPMYHVGPGKSRSNSPADSETSGVSSLDGSMSDIMNCLSLNSSSHGCYSQPLGTLMLPDVEIRPNNRAAALQRMAVKKLLANSTPCHGHHHPLSHSTHVHNRATAAAMTAAGHHYGQTDGLLNSLLSHEKSCCSPSNSHILMVNSPPVVNTSGQQILLDRAARFHRNAAALCDATCTWSGVLPPRAQFADGYSSKVFLGGVPWDINESILVATFKQFGQIRVEWPGKEQSAAQPKGFVYIIFETENQVRDLLDSCTHDFTNGGSWYYKISSKRMKGKEVQVIPWILNDSNYSKSPSQKLNPDKTVFVGALHGMLTAQGLAKIMNDLFDDVIYAGIDTDKYKYPIGSGRVTFSSKRSYRKAVAAAFIEIKTAKFTKKVQVDPYIEDSMCSGCHVQRGPYFCREEICFRYFCRSCWQWTHAMESMQHHNPMTRDSKTTPMVGLTPHVGVNFGSRMLSNYAH